MKSKDKLKEINIKSLTCYYFDDMITSRDSYSVDILLDEKYMKIFQFMIIHAKLQQVQNNCVLCSIK